MLSLGVVVPCRDQGADLAALLPNLKSVVDALGVEAGIFVIDDGRLPEIAELAQRHGVVRLRQQAPGYGGALRTAFDLVDAEFIITLEADGAHPTALLPYLFRLRDRADIVIASRYVRQGYAPMPLVRGFGSRLLNALFGSALGRDTSVGEYATASIAGYMNPGVPRSETAVRALAMLRGSEAGVIAAEAFELLREIL